MNPRIGIVSTGLSPQLRIAAAMIARGEILIVDKPETPDLPTCDIGPADVSDFTPPIQREREPWRRGRPLR